MQMYITLICAEEAFHQNDNNQELFNEMGFEANGTIDFPEFLSIIVRWENLIREEEISCGGS